MATFETVIRGGRVVSPAAVEYRDIAISGGRIAAVASPGEALSGADVVDASGKLILPGLVDAHMHLPNFAAAADRNELIRGTRAAAAGGVTTVMVMPVDDPVTVTAESFDEKREAGERLSSVDFALQALVCPAVDAFEALAARGAVSFELFMAPPLEPSYVVDSDYDLLRMLERIRDTGAPVGITANSGSLIGGLKASKQGERLSDIPALAATRPPLSQALGMARACTAAAVARARIHIRQISSRLALDLYRRFAGIAPLSCEVMSHHMLLTDEDAARMGAFGAVFPPLRPEVEAAALRAALRAGELHMVISDHSPFPRDEKLRAGDDMWKAPPGLPGLQTLCLTMLQLVEREELTLQRLVAACSENPARAFGLYPCKGGIVPGADADLVLVDPQRRTVIGDSDQYSIAEHTPYAGRSVGFAIERVFLRGRIVAQDGRVAGEARGRFVRPQSAPQALA